MDIPEGRILVHQHNPDNWRLRNLEKHPIDPNWETGTYSKCHIGFRENKRLKVNTVVFDLVIQDKKSIIRSAFVVKKIKNGIVFFDSFLFADGKPLEIPEKLFPTSQSRTRHGNIISDKDSNDLLEDMRAHSYNEYPVGTKPFSINQNDWEKMILTSSKCKDEQHFCYYRTSSKI